MFVVGDTCFTLRMICLFLCLSCRSTYFKRRPTLLLLYTALGQYIIVPSISLYTILFKIPHRLCIIIDE